MSVFQLFDNPRKCTRPETSLINPDAHRKEVDDISSGAHTEEPYSIYGG
ncbi:MAG: hypothetical protein HXS40_06090 [Theionarchaea archaeon]|nr:hypothetical protein [Theionarchaea archaeon]